MFRLIIGLLLFSCSLIITSCSSDVDFDKSNIDDGDFEVETRGKETLGYVNTETFTRTSFDFYKSYIGFDDCTYNSDDVHFVMKIRATHEDGTVDCDIFTAESVEHEVYGSMKEWGPLSLPTDYKGSFWYEFVLLPLSYDLNTLSCDEPFPTSYCLSQEDFDCCDCMQWEDVLEGMWYNEFRPNTNFGIYPGTKWLSVKDISSVLYPPAPNDISYDLGGCTCCTW